MGGELRRNDGIISAVGHCNRCRSLIDDLTATHIPGDFLNRPLGVTPLVIHDESVRQKFDQLDGSLAPLVGQEMRNPMATSCRKKPLLASARFCFENPPHQLWIRAGQPLSFRHQLVFSKDEVKPPTPSDVFSRLPTVAQDAGMSTTRLFKRLGQLR